MGQARGAPLVKWGYGSCDPDGEHQFRKGGLSCDCGARNTAEAMCDEENESLRAQLSAAAERVSYLEGRLACANVLLKDAARIMDTFKQEMAVLTQNPASDTTTCHKAVSHDRPYLCREGECDVPAVEGYEFCVKHAYPEQSQQVNPVGYGHTGPCQPDCTCDIARDLAAIKRGAESAFGLPKQSEHVIVHHAVAPNHCFNHPRLGIRCVCPKCSPTEATEPVLADEGKK